MALKTHLVFVDRRPQRPAAVETAGANHRSGHARWREAASRVVRRVRIVAIGAFGVPGRIQRRHAFGGVVGAGHGQCGMRVSLCEFAEHVPRRRRKICARVALAARRLLRAAQQALFCRRRRAVPAMATAAGILRDVGIRPERAARRDRVGGSGMRRRRPAIQPVGLPPAGIVTGQTDGPAIVCAHEKVLGRGIDVLLVRVVATGAFHPAAGELHRGILADGRGLEQRDGQLPVVLRLKAQRVIVAQIGRQVGGGRHRSGGGDQALRHGLAEGDSSVVAAQTSLRNSRRWCLHSSVEGSADVRVV